MESFEVDFDCASPFSTALVFTSPVTTGEPSTTFYICTTFTFSVISTSFFSVSLLPVPLLLITPVGQFFLIIHLCTQSKFYPQYAFKVLPSSAIFFRICFYLGLGLNTIPDKIEGICFFNSEHIEVFIYFIKYCCQYPLWLYRGSDCS